MEIKEEWKDCIGYEGILQVSNLGRVKSCSRLVKIGNGHFRKMSGRVLKPYISSNGYAFVKAGRISKHLAIHRLVAKAFIPNPNNLPCVNHKDENKQNNIIENLEWCDHSYNALYGTCQERLRKYKQKAVQQIDKDTGSVIQTFESMKIAAETLGICKEQISDVCRGDCKTAGGFFWRYAR